MKNPRGFATGYTRTDLTAITPAVERSRNQRGDVCPFPEVAQNLKDKPVTPLSGDLAELGTIMTDRLSRDFDCVGLDYNAFYPGETRIEALEVLQSAPETNEYQVFFYHSDHLGSSSFITDINGDATQHLQYACTEPVECVPFGEDFVHQQNTAAYYTPYTFSGKERDVETNLSYFGARYYESSLSIWLSVDPIYKAQESPFAAFSNNPIRYIDPDGRDTSFASDADRQFVLQFVNPTSSYYDKNYAKKFNQLVKSPKTYHFQSMAYKKGSNAKTGWTGVDPSDGAVIVSFTKEDNPNIGKYGMSEYSSLWEETFHAWDFETGGLDFNNPTAIDEAQAWKFSSLAPGTRDILPYYDLASGQTYQDYTPMYRIKHGSVEEVASWLKYGMQPKFESGRGYMGMGIVEHGRIVRGLYSNLPLR